MKFRKRIFLKNNQENDCNTSSVQKDWRKELWNDKNVKNDELNEEETVPKWYEEFADIPERRKDLTSDEIITLKKEADKVLKDETAFYHANKEKKKQGSDQAWIKTVLQKGTASDKVAAHILKIQESPVFNLSSLTSLINMVKVSKKEFSFVIDALAELFITDLLPPNLKLRQFERQPLDQLSELSSGNALSRRRRLAFWAFEDELKKLYTQMIQSLNIIARDCVEANKEKAVSVLYKLLVSHPEQEDVILSMLVNKLGDPSRKVVSKVIYSLTQLLRVHESMKQVVMNEVERLLFRPNINAKAQYYAICFLSQFHFTINDDLVACNLISIYFSFFKSCVKKGDVNSRMLGSLLMGLNRAYPYAKKRLDTLSDHINTLYKLVHLANFNISLQCLSILFQISDSSDDRFFCALYRKLSDLNLASSSHQAMFINLLFRALSKDSNISRIKTFIKRILQLCMLMPVPLACGLLYLVSQLINKRNILSSIELKANSHVEKYDDCDDDDGDEHYIDVDKQTTDECCFKEEIEEDLKVHAESNTGSDDCIKQEINEDTTWKAKDERKPCASWHHTLFQRKKHGFDPLTRNPAFANGELAVYTELTTLTRHFHPTVALFASNILEDKVITYTGDPLIDFTLVRFIERFVFKNPKKIAPGTEAKGPDPVLAQRKYYMPSGAKALPTNSRLYLQQNEEDVPIDELFLYRYLHQRQKLGYRMTKKEKDEDDDDSDGDSVASEEFEEMINNMMSKKGDIDFADDIGDNLSKEKSKKKKQFKDEGDEDYDDDDIDYDETDDGDDDFEDDIESEDEDLRKNKKRSKNLSMKEGDDEDDGDNIDDFGDDESDIDLNDIDDSDAEVMDFDDSDEEHNENMKESKKNKKGSKVDLKKLRSNISSLFAPAEQFSEMLEDTGTCGYKEGTAHALSNKDKAATKQLEWELKRNNDWTKGKKRKLQNNFKSGKRHHFFNSGKRRNT